MGQIQTSKQGIIRDAVFKAKESLAIPLKEAGIDYDLFVSSAYLTMSRTPELMECTPLSIILALRYAARIGLVPDEKNGYLVRYGKGANSTCSFIPGYQGLIKLAYRAGAKLVECRVVRQGADAKFPDEFDFEYGSNAYISHKISLQAETNKDRGGIVGAWSRVILPSDEEIFFVMNKADLKKRQNKSASKKFWTDWQDEMSAKAPFLQLSKMLPFGRDFEFAIKYNGLAESQTLPADRMFDELPEESDRKTKSSRIAEKVRGKLPEKNAGRTGEIPIEFLQVSNPDADILVGIENAPASGVSENAQKSMSTLDPGPSGPPDEEYVNLADRIRECKSVEELNMVDRLIQKSRVSNSDRAHLKTLCQEWTPPNETGS